MVPCCPKPLSGFRRGSSLAGYRDRTSVRSYSDDWRSFRAKLIEQEDKNRTLKGSVSQENLSLLFEQDADLFLDCECNREGGLWAHSLPQPEKGSLLIASPLIDMGTSSSTTSHLTETVIFLLEHSTSGGSVGLILNRPTILSLSKTMLRDEQGESSLRRNFGDSRLYCGGSHKQEIISILHKYDSVGGTEVIPGVWLGGHAAANTAVENGECDKIGFKFFSGCEMWRPGELQREIDEGLWYSASSNKAMILKQCLSLPVPLWAEVMCLMGGPYAEEASRVYGDLL